MKGKTFFAVLATAWICSLSVYFAGLTGGGGAKYLLSTLPFLLGALLLAVPLAFLAGKLVRQSVERGVAEEMKGIHKSLKSLNAGEFEPLPTDKGVISWAFSEINALNKSTQKTMSRRQRELEKLKAVLDNVAQGIVAMDDKEEIVFVNFRALEIFRGCEGLVGNTLSALIDDERLRTRLQQRTTANESFSFAYTYGKKTYDVAGSMIAETGSKGISRLIIFTDITGEQEIVRQKSEFFANASHELKTPLTVMRGLTEILLEEKNLNQQEEKRLQRLHKESVRMSELISDMLKISKLERSEEEELFEPVDVREIATEAAAELASAAQQKGVTVTVEGEGEILADSKKIFDLIVNLLTNAVNYNKENGWVRVRIDEREKTLLLCVEDGGIGIEKEHLPRLCERFYRVDKSRSKKTGGTGLGLAIVKHICAKYGARLSIESEFGKGTCVSVEFDKIKKENIA